MITAEEFLIENKVVGMTHLLSSIIIEFAKLHVEAAKKEYCKVLMKQGYVTEAGIAYFDNAYSLDNIK